MASNAPLPTAEAKVVVRNFGTETWRDSLEFDPIMLPVENSSPVQGPYTTDVFADSVMTIVSAISDAEMRDFDINGSPEYGLVWSATGYPVKGTCPVCDDVFPVSEGTGVMGDYDAVSCGCEDEDPEVVDALD